MEVYRYYAHVRSPLDGTFNASVCAYCRCSMTDPESESAV